MKKVFFVVFGIALSACSTNSTESIEQVDFSQCPPIPDEHTLQYDMNQRLAIYEAWIKSDSSLLSKHRDSWDLVYPNMIVRNVFTREIVDNIYDPTDTADYNKFAMYTITQVLAKEYLLLYYQGTYTVLHDEGNIKVLINKIFSYFHIHKDIDQRLLPLCIQEVTKLYVRNRRSTDQYGPWREWWGDETDSLGEIYNKYLAY